MKLKFPDFEKARILVVGDVMLDRYLHGQTERISPEAPVPIVHVNQCEERPGGAGNVALNISALGAKSTLLGLCGDDDNALILEKKLKSAKVDCILQKIAGKPTVTKLRVVSLHQQLIRLDFEESFHNVETLPLLKIFEQQLEHADVVVLSDYGKGTLEHKQLMIKKARAKGIPVLVDPKGKDFSVYRGANLLTPNLREFEAVVGSWDSEHEFVAKGLWLMDKYELEALLVTRGPQGMTLIRREEPEAHLPAKAREVYDVTGAGDTVIAVLATALAADCDILTAVALANQAASIVVGRLGAATVSLPELHHVVTEDEILSRGVMSEDQLYMAVEYAKSQSERIVMTNGCFDILHAGHVAYLEEAKSLGDKLIVAVNDDASVSRLKGESRPINTLERRMAVLEGLAAVDWVVSFKEDTPERLIKRICPDVLVKGGDYKVEEIAGGDYVIKNGGAVRVIRFLHDCSTTALVEKIKEEEMA